MLLRNALINAGLIITGLLTVIKTVGITAAVASGHHYTNFFLIKQAVFAAGCTSIFALLYSLQKRDRRQRHEDMKVGRARNKLKDT